MKRLITTIFLFGTLILNGQDTLRVMHHNLLNFGNFTDFCTLTNNNPEAKAAWMKSVIDYYLPDILTVNELSPDPFYHNLILNAVMNTSGRNYYQQALPTNFAGSEIINLLYFNSGKVGMASQDALATLPRDINVYKLYHKSPYLAQGADTTFIYCAVAHFKAGTTSSDQAQRAAAAEAVINYLTVNQITDPFLFMGDLNLYSNDEAAWNFLTSGSGDFRFSDPINMVGTWSQNPAFASVHTQSTRIQPGCGASGGMDDRFDFILCNPYLTSTSYPVNYTESSYTIAGQDGLRFQGSLVNPPNASLPSDMINALYNLSDHLPVMMDIVARTPQPAFLPDLFFSEYVEGTGNNKALEIFNPTFSSVDLSDYMIARYVNGSLNADTVGLAGMLQPGQTFVAVVDKRDPSGTGSNIQADPALQAVADTFLCPDQNINPTMYFNGNDAVALVRRTGEMVDLIGKIGENPGTGWTDDSLCAAGAFTSLCGATAWTTNHTMVRKFEAINGVRQNPPLFDVTLQWDTLPVNTFDSLGFHRSMANFTLPESWNYVQTMISHIITIPLDANPAFNNQPLMTGTFIGVFYTDGYQEKCAGNVQWNATGNIAIVAFGDDQLTPEKDGFNEGETILWKLFMPAENKEYDAEAIYLEIWPQHDGLFTSGGISALAGLTGIDVLTQQLSMPTGWSGISLPLNPKWPLLNDIFGDAISSVIYLSDGTSVYCPELNINEIVEWQEGTGYFIKNDEAYVLNVAGYALQSTAVELIAGWNILPVLSQCTVLTAEINTALNGKLEQIKEIAGIKVFWPENGIATLTEIQPGKAYFIKVNENTLFTFEECE
ncbi:MAG: lamin tail domain-containing protein [Bacteroidales bacterium]|nr:lamin tail domain-containing protein [Bacteroidales bacterium]